MLSKKIMKKVFTKVNIITILFSLSLFFGGLLTLLVTTHYVNATLKNRISFEQSQEHTRSLAFTERFGFFYGTIESINRNSGLVVATLHRNYEQYRSIQFRINQDTIIIGERLVPDNSGVFVSIEQKPGTIVELLPGTRISTSLAKEDDMLFSRILLFGNPL